MHKIATAEQVQQELRKITAYCEQAEQPSRQKIAEALTNLAQKVADDKADLKKLLKAVEKFEDAAEQVQRNWPEDGNRPGEVPGYPTELGDFDEVVRLIGDWKEALREATR